MHDEEASLEGEPEWLTYPHKIFQDFMGGYFLSKQTKVSKFENNNSQTLNVEVGNDSTCFHFFIQAEIQRICKCFDEMDLFWESVKFAVGLSGMTSIFTHHLLQLFVDDEIEFIHGKVSDAKGGCYSGDLKPLVMCAKEIAFAGSDMLCNPFISFVTRVPWEMHSKLYIFGPMYDYLFRFSKNEGNFVPEAIPAVPEKCSIVIRYEPCIGVADTLRTISDLNQPITNLYVHEIRDKKDNRVIIKNPVFTLDSDAKCVSIDWPEMPILEQKNLANHVARCKCIEILSTPHLPTIAKAVVPKLGNFQFLVCLDFGYCELCNETCYSMCTHVRSMKKLEELDLSVNSIDNNGVEALTDSISSWGLNSPLRKLEL